MIVTGHAWPHPQIRPEVDLGAFARPLVLPACFAGHGSMINGNASFVTGPGQPPGFRNHEDIRGACVQDTISESPVAANVVPW